MALHNMQGKLDNLGFKNNRCENLIFKKKLYETVLRLLVWYSSSDELLDQTHGLAVAS